MDLHKTQKCSHLPRVSRVNDKIVEYYTKFGQDRDLERFMRLHSPNNSNSRSSSRTSSRSSCEIFSGEKGQSKAMRRLFMSKNAERDNGSENHTSIVRGTEKTLTDQKVECVIPIVLEEHEERDAKTNTESTSQDDSLDTPRKSQRPQTNPVRTPDSIAKTHKRLEWDSLGDVGYIKSMSTSNISVLERSILREFFQETSTASTSNNPAINASEGDLQKKLKQKLFLDDVRCRKDDSTKAKAVPLASSTLLETNKGLKAHGARPKHTTTEATTSSVPQRQEQYVQTSIEMPPSTQSREVQVNMTFSHSTDGSSATRSSLEYTFLPFSSNEEIDGVVGRASRAHKNSSTTGIKDVMSQRRALADRNNHNGAPNNSLANVFEMSESLVKALTEDKENALKLPHLDLGIQLLCSLIDAKSLSRKDKKQLVRDIVKRITQLGIDVCEISETDSSSLNPTEHTTTTTANPSGSIKRNTFTKPERKDTEDTNNEVPEEKPAPPGQNSNSSSNYKDEKVLNVEVYAVNSPPTTTAKALQKQTEKSTKSEARPKTQSDKVNNFLTDPKSSTKTDIKQIRTTSGSSSSSSSDAKIEKASNDETSSNGSDATMNEWLNPLTQSEIEYEQKKRELAEQLEREKRREKQKLDEPDKEREVQLNWIDTEIQRLESLKNLLLKKDAGGKSDSRSTDGGIGKLYERSKLEVINEQSEDKLYDQVYSEPEKLEEKSSTTLSSKSAEHLVQQIEVIIEESNEDEVNFQTNLKRVKERKRETQILYDNPNLEQGLRAVPSGKPRFRTMKETVTTHEDQVIPIGPTEPAHATQRSKIDTPLSSNGSESVCSFVQQRKRQFMEHYNNKKKNQYEALQQQKKQPQISSQYKAEASTEATQATKGHYSVPNSVQPDSDTPHAQEHHSNCHQYKQPHRRYWQHHRFPGTAMDPGHSPPRTYSTTRVSYSAGLASVHTSNNNTHSSSSMLAISSEVSIPMGSNSTSSSTTTTHQYDDVAVGGSMPPTTHFFSRGPHFQSHPQRNNVAWQRHFSAGVQAEPKSIAYVISFGTAKISTNADTKDSNRLTLQQHLQLAKPKFCADSKNRKTILNKIQALRQERERELRNIVENTSLQSLDRKLTALPPPPTKHTRIVSTKEMKAITNKHYARLPEVLNKQEGEREERRRRANRIIRDVFNKRLQNRVRNGKLSLNHSRTVI